MLDATPAVPTPAEADRAAARAARPARRRAEEPTRPQRALGRRLRVPAITTVVVQLVLVMGDRMPSVDAMSYFETGRNWVAGNGYTRQGTPELHFPPVAPLTLGILEHVTGSEMAALRIWNLGWGLAIVALLTAIAWFVSRDDDATVATAWFATLVPGVVTLAIKGGSGSELATVNLILAAALLVLVTLEPERHRSWPRTVAGLAGAGVLTGLAYLTRPESLLPGATIGVAVLLVLLRDGDRTLADRLRRTVVGGAAFGVAALGLMAPYVAYQHEYTGSWSLTSKTQDASIDAWRAVAEDDRLERDQVLYAIQPTGTSLGPETVPLTQLAKEHPRGWVTIAWINTRTIFGSYLGMPWRYGPTWELIPLLLTIPAAAKLWSTRRQRSTLLFATLGAWPLLTCFAFFTLPRYLMMTTAVLIPFGAWGLVTWMRTPHRIARRPLWGIIGGLTVLSFATWAWPLLPYSTAPERTDHRTAGRWIAENTPADTRIMTRSFHIQGYSEREVVAFPYADYLSTLEFARRMGVDLIVADEGTIRRRRPELFDLLMRPEGAPDGLALLHEFTERGQTVKIYQLDPPAPPTEQPPLPLGYVSD